jgi:hypothetical protein
MRVGEKPIVDGRKIPRLNSKPIPEKARSNEDLATTAKSDSGLHAIRNVDFKCAAMLSDWTRRPRTPDHFVLYSIATTMQHGLGALSLSSGGNFEKIVSNQLQQPILLL